MLVSCVILMAVSSFNLARSSYVLEAQANRYDSVYGGLLMVCDDPKQVIGELGLPAEEYAVDPRGESAQELIFEQITASKMIGYYIRHPKQFSLMLQETIPYSSTYAHNRFAYVGEKTDENATTVYSNSWWSMVRNVLVPSNIHFYYVFSLLSLGICLIYYFVCRQSHIRIRLAMFILFSLMAFTQLFMPFLLSGWGYMVKDEFSFTLFQDMLLVFTAAFLIRIGDILGAQVGEGDEAWDEASCRYAEAAAVHPVWNRLREIGQRAGAFLDRTIWSRRLRATLVMLVFAGAILFYVMFFPPRIGTRNNGDFGRVMDAIGVRYTAEYRIHHELPTKMVVEDYEWQPYDWNRLTYKNASLSNVYVAALLRLIDEPRGILYSSYRASVVYALILLCSFGLIFYQLYDLFGKKRFLILAPVLMFMFLGKMHLG